MRMGGGAIPFSPSSIAGLTLDLNADVGVTGSPVDSWANQGSAAGSFTASLTARPTIDATGVNGKNSLVFDGSNDEMASALSWTSIAGAGAYTFFALINFTSAGAFNANGFDNAAIITDVGSLSSAFAIGGVTAGTYRWDGTSEVASRADLSAGTSQVLMAQLSGGTLTVQVGSGGTPGTKATGALSGSPTTLKLGTSYNSAIFAAFKVRRILGWNVALTAGQLAQVFAYLGSF